MAGANPLNGNSTLLGNAICHTGSVFHIPCKLTAGGINVVPPRFANSGHKTSLNEDAGKLFNNVIV
jgi:hypothetical protein